jgi:P27 family predicted phage terminase small subunit
MPSGRRSLPKVLHELHGNPSKKRLQDIEEPETRGPLGRPPRCLDKDARAVWLDLQDVMPVAVLASCDLPLVTAYCQAVAQHHRAVIALRETGGAVITGAEGGMAINPLSRVVDRQALLILRLGSELALTPTARAGMAARIAQAGGSMSSPGRSYNSLQAYLDAKPDKLEPN